MSLTLQRVVVVAGTSGIACVRPGPGWTLATGACGAMNPLTRALAVELARIQVAPGRRHHVGPLVPG
jgi:hypothetical protein